MRCPRFTLLIVLLAAGCERPPIADCPAGTGRPMRIYHLYFGRDMGKDGFVSDQAWQAFRDTVVTPNLPAGYTVADATGAWKKPGGEETSIEPSKVMTVALPPDPAGMDAIGRVRQAYETRFHQNLVGMVVQPGCGTF